MKKEKNIKKEKEKRIKKQKIQKVKSKKSMCRRRLFLGKRMIIMFTI